MKVEMNDTVKVHYTGSFENGDVFDSSQGGTPLEFTLGAGQIIPGFEKAVVGMEKGDAKKVTIAPEDAYGEVREELKQQVSKEVMPEGLNPEVGMQLMSTLPNGQEIPVTIAEVTETHVTVDANHQLAGKTLVFDIELVEIVK